MSSGNSSDDLPTSTRTPSFSSSSYNIEVQKRRINYQASSRGTGGSIRGSVEDPFSDAMVVACIDRPSFFTNAVDRFHRPLPSYKCVIKNFDVEIPHIC